MRGWWFVFSDVRRGGGRLSSVILGEGVVVCLQSCQERGGCLSSVMLGEVLVVCLQ